MNLDKQDKIFFTLMILIFFFFAPFIIGSLIAIDNGHCKRRTIASYYPTYLLGCALFTERFNDLGDGPISLEQEK